MKGILITKSNQSKIGVQYNIDHEDFDDLVPIGYILISDFGGEWYEGVVTLPTFDEFFLKGETLENEYFVVTRKP
jgi:hypothetical protein